MSTPLENRPDNRLESTPPTQAASAHNGHSSYYVGLMSGTSMDGVDGVVVDLSNGRCQVLAHQHVPFSSALKEELLALNQSGEHELHRAALASNELALLYAQVVARLLTASQLPSTAIVAIGAHGQTVRHCPSSTAADGGGYTIQLNNPALLAYRSRIDVVADFRRRDVAAGGQGAPLVPAFHQAVFGAEGRNIAVLNIGGIANVSLLRGKHGELQGFDTGPGNVLMDGWIHRHLAMPYDAHGHWASEGVVSQALLDKALQHPYFSKSIPKSTGRDLFHLAWLEALLSSCAEVLSAVDVQATLLELTVQSIARALAAHAKRFATLYVCGGGALNEALMRRLQAALPRWQVATTERLGLPVMQVEAAAFAWLAQQCCERRRLLLAPITGAQDSGILGAIYPA